MSLAALILALIAVMLWAFSAGAGVYLWWRYVYKPWAVMRTDVQALQDRLVADVAGLDRQLAALDDYVRPSRIQSLTDEEAASRERRYRMKRQATGLVVP